MMMDHLRLSLLVLLAVLLISQPATANPDYWVTEGWGDTDFGTHSVDYLEIRSGGPPKDGIPSIDDPQFLPVSEITDIGEEEPVVTVSLEGVTRAYPLRILMWHEIVNDVIGERAVTITYCPLCNSAVVYDREVGDQILDFGTTGKLRNSDLVMYDRQTQSWWQQFIGEAIVGEMTGTKLTTIPARVESFSRFRDRYPDGDVLVPNNDRSRRYGHNPYAAYDSRLEPYVFLYGGALPDYIAPMARIVSFELNGEPYAVAMELLRSEEILDIDDVRLSWEPGQNSALDTGSISEGRDVGNIVVQRRSDTGYVDMVYDVTFAFVFNAFHPDFRIRQE